MIYFLIAVISVIIVGIYIKRKKSNKNKVTVKSIEESTIRYENFGHYFSIEDVVTKELSKINKPSSTNFYWEANEEKIIITLKHMLEESKSLKDEVSLIRTNQFGYQETYKEAYARNSNCVNHYMYSTGESIKSLVQDDIKDSAKDLCIVFRQKYPDEYAIHTKLGTV